LICILRQTLTTILFPYTTLFRSELDKLKKQTISGLKAQKDDPNSIANNVRNALVYGLDHPYGEQVTEQTVENISLEVCQQYYDRSEEHTSELQSRENLVCRLLLE